MKPIRDLPRLRCAAADAAGVRPVAISADDPNAGMNREPGGHGIAGAHREHIHDAPSLQVHEDRAEMLLALLPGPVSMPTTRRVLSTLGGGAPRLTTRTMVSAPIGMPRRSNSRSPARPPNA